MVLLGCGAVMLHVFLMVAEHTQVRSIDPETADEIEEDEARLRGLAKKSGMPMTREEYRKRTKQKRTQ